MEKLQSSIYEDLERYLQLCSPDVKRRETHPSIASVFTAEARRHSSLPLHPPPVGKRSTFSSGKPSATFGNSGDSGSKNVRSTTELFGHAAIIQEEKARQENVRKYCFRFFLSVLVKGTRHILTRTSQLQRIKKLNGQIKKCTKRLKETEKQLMKFKTNVDNMDIDDDDAKEAMTKLGRILSVIFV